MDLIPAVVNTIVILAEMLALGLVIAYVGVALARISLDIFK